MKFIKTRAIISVFAAVTSLPIAAFSQIYSVSAPISGNFQLGITAVGPHDDGLSPGGAITVDLGTLTDIIYYDAVSNTLRQVGSITTSAATNSFFINTSTGQPAPYSLAITQILTSNVLTFDTGVYLMGQFPPNGIKNIGPVSGTYSFVTGGQTNTGIFNYTLSASSFGAPFTQVSTANYPASLDLSGGFANYNSGEQVFRGPGDLADLTATNGDQVRISTGTSDSTDDFNWSEGSLTATLVGSPAITNQPSGVSSVTGGAATLSVGVSGTAPFTYQWYFNGAIINSATNAALSLSNLTSANVGLYTVSAANAAGSTLSAPISLTLVDLKMFAGVVINGPIGQNYDVQSTPALGSGTNWTTLTNIAITTQPYIYIDYSSPTNAQQFYRAVPNP